MLSEALQHKLAGLPTQPGVYVMKDRQGEVVYVGKAVNLRARVHQYFQERSSDTRAFIPFLEDLLGDLEVMITPSEKDALLLENELIKQHRPKFNVKLRDDKNFISLRLRTDQPYPRLEVVRRMRKDGARYFGPYSSASSIRETLTVINRHFQLRTCTDSVMSNRRRPCLQYQIKRCPAPCVYDVPSDDYAASVRDVGLFLEGKADELTVHLKTRMKEAASSLEFERAAQLRDQLHAIDRSLEKQRTVFAEQLDQDVLGFHREGGLLELQLLFFRGGRLSGGRSFSFARQEFPTEELISSFLDQYYGDGGFIPKELILPILLEGAESLEVFLSDRKNERVRIHVPERGDKMKLLEMARENAVHNFQERQRNEKNSIETLQRLQTRLRLPRLPRRIECFDISTFQGQLTVGSQVVFMDGEADKSKYRLFKVRGEAAGDDFASMYQVLTRRLAKGKENGDLPDLLLIDGGKGQLNVARAALRELGLTPGEVPLAGLAKSRVLEDEARFAARQGFALADAWEARAGGPAEDASDVPEVDDVERASGSSPDPTEPVAVSAETAPHDDGEASAGSLKPEARSPLGPPAPDAPSRLGRSRKKGRFAKDELERSPERVFLPGQKNPVVLRQNTGELFLLARLRDEAHRFAITFHRKLRRERNFKSVLEEIPGIGQKRKRSLLAHFGSLKRVRAATQDEIAEVEGFNAALAQRVREFLMTQPQPTGAQAEAEEAAAREAAAAPEDAEAEVLGADPIEAAQLLAEEQGGRDDVAFDAAAAELSALEIDRPGPLVPSAGAQASPRRSS